MAEASKDPFQMKVRTGDWTDVLSPGVIDHYVGRHIAIIFKRVIASGNSYDEVLESALKLYPDEIPYVAYIPAKDTTTVDAVAQVQESGPSPSDEQLRRDFDPD